MYMASRDNINLKSREEVTRKSWTTKPQIGVGVKEIKELLTKFRVKEQQLENNFYRPVVWTKSVPKFKLQKGKNSWYKRR